jgi:hypothetical protein
MPQLRPSWQLSVTIAAVLAVLFLACYPVRRRWADVLGAFAGEFTLVMCLLAVWQFVGRFVHSRVEGAFTRAHEIVRLQHAWHLPSELTVQRLVLPHHALVWAMDAYYDFVHLNSMAVFLVWMWWRHRDHYPRVRNTVVLTTLACLLVQAVPVAPPRMLTDLGFVDTALLYGQSVYGPFGSGISNQLAAMPSVHVAWAAIVAWYVVRVTRGGWRVIGPTHLALTLLAVVATANHWWLDGIVAIGLMAVAILAQELPRLVRSRPGALLVTPLDTGPARPADAADQLAPAPSEP